MISVVLNIKEIRFFGPFLILGYSIGFLNLKCFFNPHKNLIYWQETSC